MQFNHASILFEKHKRMREKALNIDGEDGCQVPII